MPNKCYGKLPAIHDERTIHLENYMSTKLPPPPEAYESLDILRKNFSCETIEYLMPMDANDQYGDCTICGLAHAITIYKGLISVESIMPEKEVVKLYFKLTKGEDSGLPCLTVLNFWKNHIVANDQAMAFAAIDPKNQTIFKQAISLFGGIYLGFVVQENAESDFDNKKIWQPGKSTGSGHCVFVTGYDKDTVTLITWGSIQKASWEWVHQQVDEAFAIIPLDAKNPAFTGHKLSELQNDLNQISR